MSEACNRDVIDWVDRKFGIRMRGLVTRGQADGYNRAHPDRPYTGPVRNTESWQRWNVAAKWPVAENRKPS